MIINKGKRGGGILPFSLLAFTINLTGFASLVGPNLSLFGNVKVVDKPAWPIKAVFKLIIAIDQFVFN
jgi:hypothetical protein